MRLGGLKEGKATMATQKSGNLINELPREIEPYVGAMLGASGLGHFDAITSVLFAMATHLELQQYPILVYLGARGTGKSAAMRQLFRMCKLEEAKVLIEQWRREYNQVRPHSSLGYRPPATEAILSVATT